MLNSHVKSDGIHKNMSGNRTVTCEGQDQAVLPRSLNKLYIVM